MKKPIYFSKVEYVEHWGKHKSIILLNLAEGNYRTSFLRKGDKCPRYKA